MPNRTLFAAGRIPARRPKPSPTYILVVTQREPLDGSEPEDEGEVNADELKDYATVYFCLDKATAAYQKAVEGGAYGASLCSVMMSTDY